MEPKIRPIEFRDIEQLRVEHNDLSTLLQLHDTTLVSETAQQEWFYSLQKSKVSQRLVVVDDDDKLMCVVRVDRYDQVNSCAMLGLDVMKAWRGKKLSYWVYESLFDYFFNHRNINRIYLDVLSTNTVAYFLYQKLGFKTEGVHREAAYRYGKFVDVISMAILRSEYHDDAEMHAALKNKFVCHA